MQILWDEDSDKMAYSGGDGSKYRTIMIQRQVSFTEAVKRAFQKYCCFTGRASRSEYWWFSLFVSIIFFVLYIPVVGPLNDMEMGMETEMSGFQYFLLTLLGVFYLAIVLPSLGLLWRRLHDTGRSGWNALWSIVPLIGSIILLVFCLLPSEMRPNKYGDVPNLEDSPKY